MRRVTYSITGNSVKSCTGFCRYCSAARQMEYDMGTKYLSGALESEANKAKVLKDLEEIDEKCYSEFIMDKAKLFEALDNDKQIKPLLANKTAEKEGVTFHADIWQADPLSALTSLSEIVSALEEYCKERGFKCSLSTSTNGIPFLRDEACDFLQEHNMGIQLSHDGLGQWIRTNDFDPMNIPNARRLMKEGTLSAVNTTLNYWNSDIWANLNYWNNHLKDIFDLKNPKDWQIYNQLYIKLNHIYDGQYDIKAKNVNGLFNGKSYDALKGVEIGNLNFRNDRELAEKYGIRELGTVLTDYLHGYKRLALLMNDPTINQINYIPFKKYIEGQIARFSIIKSHEDGIGACRNFQRWKYDVGNMREKYGDKYSQTFVIDTTGRYSECNLIDADSNVANPGGEQPDYCKGCKYEFAAECNICGSEKFASRCEYNYEWEVFLEEMQWIHACIENNKKFEKEQLQKRVMNNLFGDSNNNKCNCKGK